TGWAARSPCGRRKTSGSGRREEGVELPPKSPTPAIPPTSSPEGAEEQVRVISSANLKPPKLGRWVVPVLLATFGLHLLERQWPLPMALSLLLVFAGGISAAAA